MLLVRDDPLRVLMLRRGSTRGAFPSALVFPGGVLEAADEAEARAHGHRAHDLGSDEIAALRVTAARETWEETGVRVAPEDLVPFGRWVTPVTGVRRFDTDFFLAAAPKLQEPTADGVEAVALRWVEPRLAHEITDEMLLLPTLMNLKRLAEFASVAAALAAAPEFPRDPVTATVGFDADGTPVIRIPVAAGYGITEYRPPEAATPYER